MVGAGPSGLSCAYFLALMGRPSVVFEKQPVPGGMLALGIPEYRLPKRTLQQDIDFILRHGVELRTASPVESVEDLFRQGFRAVYLATGAQKSRAVGHRRRRPARRDRSAGVPPRSGSGSASPPARSAWP